MRSHSVLAAAAAAGVALLCLGAATGCATRVTEAKELGKDVAAYRARQTARVERINQDYRRTHARLSEDLDRLGRDELASAFGIDAVRDADEFISNFAVATLHGQFRDRIEHNVAAQRAKIDEVEAAIAAARNAYADSYQEAQLKLQSLKAVEARLQVLATAPDEQKQLRETLDKLVKAYKQVRKREKEEAAAATAAATGTDADGGAP